MTTLLAVAILALVIFSALMLIVARVVLSYRIDQPPTVAEPFDPTELIDRIDNLTLAVDEGIRRVDRAESRIQKTVTSARKLVRENGLAHAGIEAEFEELQPPDEERNVAVQALSAHMDPTRIVRVPGGSFEIGAA